MVMVMASVYCVVHGSIHCYPLCFAHTNRSKYAVLPAPIEATIPVQKIPYKLAKKLQCSSFVSVRRKNGDEQLDQSFAQFYWYQPVIYVIAKADTS